MPESGPKKKTEKNKHYFTMLVVHSLCFCFLFFFEVYLDGDLHFWREIPP